MKSHHIAAEFHGGSKALHGSVVNVSGLARAPVLNCTRVDSSPDRPPSAPYPLVQSCVSAQPARRCPPMLTDTQVRGARPSAHPRKLFDARGLYLHVMPNGGRYWRFNYRFNRKQRTLALGVYPDVSLAKARIRHQDARRQLAEGIDPATEKRASEKCVDRLSYLSDDGPLRPRLVTRESESLVDFVQPGVRSDGLLPRPLIFLAFSTRTSRKSRTLT